MARILVVDDDPTVREVVVSYLRAAGHVVAEVADGNEAMREFSAERPDLVVLDLMLPGIDGLEVCRRIRTASEVPVVMLTALGEEGERVAGLERGADDYVTKPFSPRELVLRIGSVLRRTSSGPVVDQSVIIDGNLRLDPAAHQASLSGRELNLTSREFDLLAHLLRHAGRALSRDDLMRDVWGWSFGDESTITVHVRRLREKIEADPTKPRRLVTVWGVGYRWERADG